MSTVAIVMLIIIITLHVSASESPTASGAGTLFFLNGTNEGNESPGRVSDFPDVTQLVSEAQLSQNLGLLTPSPAIFSPKLESQRKTKMNQGARREKWIPWEYCGFHIRRAHCFFLRLFHPGDVFGLVVFLLVLA